MRERGGPVIGVIGGSGGVGSSSFAAVLALVGAPALLVDLDALSGGVDVLLGAESVAGARWSGLRLAGGHLDPDDLLGGLPAVEGAEGTAVLAADTAMDAEAVTQVVEAGASRRTVVLDLPRSGGEVRDAGLACCDLVVLLARTDVAGLVAAHATATAVLDVLAEGRADSVGLIARRGELTAAAAADLVGLPLLGELPAATPGRFSLDVRHPPRAASRLAAGLIAGARS